jgi:glycosidase
LAENTSTTCRNLVIYEVFVRNHGPDGTFSDVESDLERIRELGVDVIWFMPIHPIGQASRKGSLGSPYSIRDYRAVNPELGTVQDFRRLVERVQACGMKVMLDIVFNHAAFDSELVQEHIEWFHRGSDGGPYRASQGWTDVVGFSHPQPELSRFLIDVLEYWATFGVDGFRCDTASLLPKKFWHEARRQVCSVRPNILWLAESVSIDFIAYERAGHRTALSDSELYQSFDLTHDYDIWPIWNAAVVGKVPVARYLEMLRFQDSIYPENYAKLRCVENHDSKRIMDLAPSRSQARAWIAFQAFNKGAYLIYAGQESAVTRTPSLFNKDPIAWNNYELQPFLKRLLRLKKDVAQMRGHLSFLAAEPTIQAIWAAGRDSLYGVFNVGGINDEVCTSLPDGVYRNLLDDREIVVRSNRVPAPADALIVRCNCEHCNLKPFYSDLIDFCLS